MRIIILILSLSSLSVFAQGNLKQSAFMKAFHDCVANYSGEELDDETLGVAESALMNGEFINGNIDAGYFSFMNCITPATVSSSPSSLSSDLWCPHTDYTVNSLGLGVTLQLPYKRNGESVVIQGLKFACESGGWNFISATDNNGVDEDCESRVVTDGACRFELPDSQHSGVVSVFNTTVGSDGSYRAYCNDGSFEVIGSNCIASTCEVGERVTWVGFESGEAIVCQGSVNANGSVVATPGDVRDLFSTIDIARQQSKIMFGTAKFTCRNNQWQRVDGAGFCRHKTADEKTCMNSSHNNAFCQ